MYNATLYQIDPTTRATIGIYLAEIDAEGKIVRSTWRQETGHEGTAEYEGMLLTTDCSFHVVPDGGQGFWQIVRMTSAFPDGPYSAHAT
jgi:hypothetical protein